MTGETQMTLASRLLSWHKSKVVRCARLQLPGPCATRYCRMCRPPLKRGFGDFIATQWVGLLTTSGTPPEIVKRLNTAVNEALKDEGIQAKLAQQGVKTVGGTSEQFRSLIATDLANWERIARATKIEPQ